MFSLTDEQLYAMDVQGVRALRPSGPLSTPALSFSPAILTEGWWWSHWVLPWGVVVRTGGNAL